MKKSHNYWITTAKPEGSPHPPHTMVVWGLWQEGCFLFSTGSQSRKARNLAQNPNCIVCTEHASEAVIVEGVAEIADVPARRKFLPAYERKYKFDMSTMKDGIALDEGTGVCCPPARGVRVMGKILPRAAPPAGSSTPSKSPDTSWLLYITHF